MKMKWNAENMKWNKIILMKYSKAWYIEMIFNEMAINNEMAPTNWSDDLKLEAIINSNEVLMKVMILMCEMIMKPDHD